MVQVSFNILPILLGCFFNGQQMANIKVGWIILPLLLQHSCPTKGMPQLPQQSSPAPHIGVYEMQQANNQQT